MPFGPLLSHEEGGTDLSQTPHLLSLGQLLTEPTLGRIIRWAIEINDCGGESRQEREGRVMRSSVRAAGQVP